MAILNKSPKLNKILTLLQAKNWAKDLNYMLTILSLSH